jgi:hypothetical protein
MSETNPAAVASDAVLTHADVQAATLNAAGGVEAVAAATDAAMAKAAPDNEFAAFMAAAEARLTKLEETIFGALPQIREIYASLETPVETIVPQSVPVFAAIDTLGGTVNALLSALGAHFGAGKLNLPDAVPPLTPAQG